MKRGEKRRGKRGRHLDGDGVDGATDLEAALLEHHERGVVDARACGGRSVFEDFQVIPLTLLAVLKRAQRRQTSLAFEASLTGLEVLGRIARRLLAMPLHSSSGTSPTEAEDDKD